MKRHSSSSASGFRKRQRPSSPPAGQHGQRCILHIDLDCFYAAVVEHDRPELKGRPVGVRQKSILATTNYEARSMGVRKLMRVEEALAACPGLVVVDGENLDPFREASEQVYNAIRDITQGKNVPIHRRGLDEFTLDITAPARRKIASSPSAALSFGTSHVCGAWGRREDQRPPKLLVAGAMVAEVVRSELFSRTGYAACGGIAPNPMLAQIACKMKKPFSQTVLLPSFLQAPDGFLAMNVRALPGIGRRLAKQLADDHGVHTVGELQKCPDADERLGRLAAGVDDTEVFDHGPCKSLSVEDSFFRPPVSADADVRAHLTKLAAHVGERLERDGRTPKTVRLRVRFLHEASVSRQAPLGPSILATALSLWDRMASSSTGKGKDVTLLGVGVTNFD